jgi:hypothetical protein
MEPVTGYSCLLAASIEAARSYFKRQFGGVGKDAGLCFPPLIFDFLLLCLSTFQ